MCSGIDPRQRLHAKLAADLLHDSTHLRPRRLADEADDDDGLNRLVESYLVEVDVRERAAQRMLLVLLQHRVMWSLLTLDDDVDDRVETRGARQRYAEVALADDDRARMTLPVENAGDEPLPAQPPRVPRAKLRLAAFTHLECDPVPGHGGEW